MKINSKLYFSILFLSFVFFSFSQEVKFIDPYGKPLKKNKVIVYGQNNDTLITNSKGLINLKKTLKFDSISLIKNKQPVLTKSQADLSKAKNKFSLGFKDLNSLPVFETNTKKSSQVNDALKEIHHESVVLSNIYSSNVSSGADLLLLTDGVTIQQSQAGGGSPIIRGFEANRVLLMVDGVRMNNAIYRGGHLQNSITIDPFIIENCDIIYGPSAVSYGSDAIGGVVHYKTINPKLSKKRDSTTNNGVYFNRFNSASEEISHHINYNYGSKKWASFSAVTYKQFGDLRMGKKRKHGDNDWGKVHQNVYLINNYDTIVQNMSPFIQKGVGYEQIDLTQKLIFQPFDNLSVLFNSQLSRSTNIARFDQLNNLDSLNPQFGDWYYGPQERWLNSTKINYTNPNNLFDELSGNFSYQDIEESRFSRKFRTSLRQENLEKISVLGTNIKAIKKTGDYSSVSYGTEIYKNNVTSKAKIIDINNDEDSFLNTRYPSGGSNLIMTGIYAIYTLKKDHVSILSGLRYTTNNINGTYSDSAFNLLFPQITLKNNSFNGSLNFSYYPHKRTKINIDLSTGFRSPNIDDIGKIFTKDNFITVPNVDLSHEYAYNCAIGWTQKFYLFNNTLKLNLYNAAYMTLLKDVILKRTFNVNGFERIEYNNYWYDVLANQNGNDALVYGINSSIDIGILENFNLHSSLAVTKGYLTENQTPFGHIPPLFGNIKIQYKNDKVLFSLFSMFNGAKKRADFGPENVDNPNEANAIGFPKWCTINSSFSYNITENIVVNIGCYNVFDIHYKTFASGISSQGRSLLATLRLTY